MISTDLEYYRAESINEATKLYQQLNQAGKSPIFFNGGTEIITMLRLGKLYMEAQALIDIKKIPECTQIDVQDDRLIIGASVPLAQIEETCDFPLLSKNCSRIADHTSRQKITIGGNICGKIKYNEALLPLLLTDADVLIADKSGLSEVSIQKIYDKNINLEPGSFIVKIIISKSLIDAPFISKKVTKISRIGYPLLTVSALKAVEGIRFAFSGLCEYPFRSIRAEQTLNNPDKSVKERIKDMMGFIPAPILNDLHGSSSYRQFVLSYILDEALQQLEEEAG